MSKEQELSQLNSFLTTNSLSSYYIYLESDKESICIYNTDDLQSLLKVLVKHLKESLKENTNLNKNLH